MASLISKLYLRALVLLICLPVSSLGQNLLSCDTTSPDASGYRCGINGSEDRCGTFAVFRANSYYSSLSNLSFYLGLNKFAIAEANGFSAQTEFLSRDQPLLLPIDCKCNNGFFHADVTKTTIKGDSFYSIAESLQGLTTCKVIREKNPGISPWGLDDKVRLLVPLRCACPSPTAVASKARLLLSYPVIQGDTISNLAAAFNTTPEAIISANNRSLEAFKPESLVTLTSLLIPLNGEPLLGSLVKPSEPNPHFSETSIPVIHPSKKKPRMWKVGVYIAVCGVVIGAIIAVAATFLVIQLKRKKKENLIEDEDLEQQQLSLSVRTASEKKVSFAGSQDTGDCQIIDSVTPRKVLLELYTIEELRKATEDFNPSTQIEGSVYHGHLNGKNLAIRRTRTENISKVETKLFADETHQHPNIIRLLGTCVTEGSDSDSFLVFEYARNGSLKDWLHGGLAMKNQFIASCYCFLTWKQRLKISLDVAVALQYMHQVMNPSYAHRNVKSRNIFLDEDFNAKIGNFGMARCVEDDTKYPDLSTNPASWSLGYLAPEYLHQGVISPAIDIFAYGIVLLEILSGQTPISRPDRKGGGNVWLSEKIKAILQSESADELREWMDSALGENYSFDTAVTLANLARACTEEDPCSRPGAGEIVEKLSRLVEESPEGEDTLIFESSCKPLVNPSSTTTNL
ncbi:LysM-containing receptor-like kinase 2 [Hibiscus trionum]|uniref:LysM-containing receptor-like kinase 2 n=1 Tax=Hibiscus trionum TaxID=183268 RepID=A0A9W7JAR6_HIBTR|nr:LysM-containing receptor-like kinase 2 [Hibiscus trionum]